MNDDEKREEKFFSMTLSEDLLLRSYIIRARIVVTPGQSRVGYDVA